MCSSFECIVGYQLDDIKLADGTLNNVWYLNGNCFETRLDWKPYNGY